VDLAKDTSLDRLRKGATAVFRQRHHDRGETFLYPVERRVEVSDNNRAVLHDFGLRSLHRLIGFCTSGLTFLLGLLFDLAIVGLGVGGGRPAFALFARAFRLKDGRTHPNRVAPSGPAVAGAHQTDRRLGDRRREEWQLVRVEGGVARLELGVGDVDDVSLGIVRIRADRDPGLVQEIGRDFAPLPSRLVGNRGGLDCRASGGD
jgi:hypothetical protein